MFILKTIFSTLKQNKYLIVLGFILTFVFSILLLPYQDINTYINSQISTYTKGQVQFKSKSVFISPFLSLLFTDNLISYKKLEIPVKKISIKPLWLDSLLLNFGAEINAYSIFGGDIQFLFKKKKSKNHSLVFNANLHNISLEQLAFSSIKLSGKISAALKILMDPNFLNTPNIQLQINNRQKIKILNSKIPSPFGPLQIPSMSFSQLKAQITTKNDTLNIKALDLGSGTDNLQIKITGTVNLKIKKERSKKSLSIQNYKLGVYIKAQKVPSQWKSLFSLIKDYKVGNTYRFHIKGKSLSAIPEITK